MYGSVVNEVWDSAIIFTVAKFNLSFSRYRA